MFYCIISSVFYLGWSQVVAVRWSDAAWPHVLTSSCDLQQVVLTVVTSSLLTYGYDAGSPLLHRHHQRVLSAVACSGVRSRRPAVLITLVAAPVVVRHQRSLRRLQWRLGAQDHRVSPVQFLHPHVWHSEKRKLWSEVTCFEHWSWARLHNSLRRGHKSKKSLWKKQIYWGTNCIFASVRRATKKDEMQSYVLLKPLFCHDVMLARSQENWCSYFMSVH